SLEGHLERDRAVQHDDAEPGPLICSKPLAELGRFGSWGGMSTPHAAPHDRRDGLDLTLVVLRPGLVPLGTHRCPAKDRKCGHLSLLSLRPSSAPHLGLSLLD